MKMSKLRGLAVLGAVLALTGLIGGTANASQDVRAGKGPAVVSAKAKPGGDQAMTKPGGEKAKAKPGGDQVKAKPGVSKTPLERPVVQGVTLGPSAVTAPSGAVTVQGAGCGSYCAGRSPKTFDVCPKLYGTAVCGGEPIYCNGDAVTKGVAYRSTGWAELRYSAQCRTAWVNSYHPNAEYFDSWIDSTSPNAYSRPDGAGVNYSVMVNDAGYTASAFIRFCSSSCTEANTIWY